MNDELLEKVLAIAVLFLLIWNGVQSDDIRKMKEEIKTLRAYNEEVWRTFNQMREANDEQGNQQTSQAANGNQETR